MSCPVSQYTGHASGKRRARLARAFYRRKNATSTAAANRKETHSSANAYPNRQTPAVSLTTAGRTLVTNRKGRKRVTATSGWTFYGCGAAHTGFSTASFRFSGLRYFTKNGGPSGRRRDNSG